MRGKGRDCGRPRQGPAPVRGSRTVPLRLYGSGEPGAQICVRDSFPDAVALALPPPPDRRWTRFPESEAAMNYITGAFNPPPMTESRSRSRSRRTMGRQSWCQPSRALRP